MDVIASDGAHAAETERGTANRFSKCIKIDITRSIRALADLRKFWKGSPGHRDSDFDVYRLLLTCRSDIIEPYVLTIYRDGQPEALLAGRIVNAELQFKIGYFTFFRTKIRTLNIPYGGLRGSESDDNCRLLLETIRAALARGEFDRVDFEPLRTTSRLYRIAKENYARVAAERQTMHRYLELPESMAQFYADHPGVRRRRNHGRNRFQTDCGREPALRQFTRASEVAEFVELAEQVAGSTYQRALRVGFSAEDAQTRELLRLGAEKGWLRAFVIFDNKTPMAFLSCTFYEGVAYLDFIGFKKEYGRYSPGLLILLHALEVFCLDGAKVVDFGRGDAWYKQDLSTTQWIEAPICLFRPTVAGRTLELLRTTTQIADDLVKRTLQQTGLLSSLKKAWRARISNAPPKVA